MAIAALSFLTAVAIGVAWSVADLEPWYLAMAAVFVLFGVVVLATPRSWQTTPRANR
jgi:hypothetical protein